MPPNSWTQKDAVALRGYLIQNPKLLAHLRALRPDKNADRADYGSQMRGMDRICEELEALRQDPQRNDLPAGFIPATDEAMEGEEA